MNQAEIRKLIPAIRVGVCAKRKKFSNPKGPEGRLHMLRATLIADAIKYGDCYRPTMETADYWLTEKQLVHKLFKVLVPRYKDTKDSYTRVHKAPNIYPGYFYERSVLELR
ncbi:39S ribosomal protein L17-like, partial [Homarus americanus]